MRNIRYDSLKGLAIILVAFEHILQVTTANYADTKIHSFIFGLQMPLFIILSGYFSTKKVAFSIKEWKDAFFRRTAAYMIPFFSKILIFDQILNINQTSIKENLHNIFPNAIDNGLWFLWVVYFLYIHMSVSMLITDKIKKAANSKRLFLEAFVYFVTLFPWILIAFFVESRFLGARLILYYSIFYLLGHIYRWYIEKRLLNNNMLKDALMALFLVIGSVITFRYNFISTGDGIVFTSLRMIAGVSLSFFLIFIFDKYPIDKYVPCLPHIGRYTLEIFYVHGVAFALLRQSNPPVLYSIEGVLIVFLSCFITVSLTTIIIAAIKSNRFTDFLIFGKIKRE